MSVHYKFKTGLNFDKVTFDGVHISIADLKKAIMQQKKIGKSADFDLQITNQQTKEVYNSDDALIPKNTTVIVARVPVTGNKKNWEKNEINTTTNTSPAHVALEKIIKSLDLSNADVSEDEKIKQVMSQSTQDYDSSKFVKSRGMVGPLPPNYTCYRCGQPGHYIKHCPTNNMEIKRSTGIPRSFMIPASADQKGALLTASGEYAVPIIDHEAYKEVKKEKLPFAIENEQDVAAEEQQIPEELQCMLCRNLLHDAVLIACCGSCYCDECIRTSLLDSEQHECPTCHKTGISPDTLIPNRFLRNAVKKFKNETGYVKSKSENDVDNASVQPPSANEASESCQKSPIDFDPLCENNVEPAAVFADSDALESQVEQADQNVEREHITNAQEDSNDVSDSIEQSERNELSKVQEDNDGGDSDKGESEKPSDLEDQSDATKEAGKPNAVNEQIKDFLDTSGSEIPSLNSDNKQSKQSGSARNVIRPVTSLVPGGVQYNRGPILPLPPRGLFPRPGIPPDARFYRAPMRDPHGYSMALGPMPYGYAAPPMRPHGYHDPYAFMAHRPPHTHSGQFPRSHMGTHPQSYAEPPPPGSSPHNMIGDNNYGSYPSVNSNDFEDPLDKFAKQLQSKSRRKRISRSKSRSKSRGHSRSRSRSRRSRSNSSRSSSSSSKSRSFSFSSSSRSSYSVSSRSRSRSPYARRSSSRNHRKKYSRSKSPRHRHGYRYRKCRSPTHGYTGSRHNNKQTRRSCEKDRYEGRSKHRNYNASQASYFDNVKNEPDRSRKVPVKERTKRSSHYHSSEEKRHNPKALEERPSDVPDNWHSSKPSSRDLPGAEMTFDRPESRLCGDESTKPRTSRESELTNEEVESNEVETKRVKADPTEPSSNKLSSICTKDVKEEFEIPHDIVDNELKEHSVLINIPEVVGNNNENLQKDQPKSEERKVRKSDEKGSEKYSKTEKRKTDTGGEGLKQRKESGPKEEPDKSKGKRDKYEKSRHTGKSRDNSSERRNENRRERKESTDEESRKKHKHHHKKHKHHSESKSKKPKKVSSKDDKSKEKEQEKYVRRKR